MTVSKREGEVISTARPVWRVTSLNKPLTISQCSILTQLFGVTSRVH